MEKKEKNCECNWSCKCCSNGIGIATIILVIIGLACGACLWTNLSNKVDQMGEKIDQMHKLIVEMSYWSAENFNKVYEKVMTDEYIESINSQIEAQLGSLGETSEGSTESATGELVNPTDEEWNGSDDEAYKLFGLSWTPGNAIINTKTRMYKAIGGAYPKASFDEAIAQLKEGSAQTDEIGNAGYLSETQLAKLLDGVYYKNDNKNAEIVIVEYSDLICPYCQRHFDNKTLETIVEEDSSVALVFKNMPLSFHPTADLGAKGVECAGEIAGTDAYYNFLEKAFATAEADGQFTNDSLANIAKELKIDAKKFESCLNK